MNENENVMQIKDRKMAKYRNYTGRFRKTFRTALIILLVLILLPIGAFFGYVGYVNIGKHEIYTCETPDGHTLTVVQNGQQNPLIDSYRFTVKIDGKACLELNARDSEHSPVYNKSNFSCSVDDRYGEITLDWADGTQIRFSADQQKILFLRCAFYTLHQKDMEIVEHELIDWF